MFGLIGKIRTVADGASELAAILLEGTTSMPGNVHYLVARDAEDPDALWVTEVWVDEESHAASLRLPSVQAAIARGRPLIVGFEQQIRTVPLEHGGDDARVT